MEDDGTPVGGRFSFDDENRQRLPRHLTLPNDVATLPDTALTTEARQWLASLPCAQPIGEPTHWLPINHAEATSAFTDFLESRLAAFGPYEDAISTSAVRLFHSALSPLFNSGLLCPHTALSTTLDWATKNATPHASLEGFVRQLLGWREFIRAAYVVDGVPMRTRNFFGHTRPLPTGSWDGTTGLLPLDHTIKTALQYGYTHHIERLMVAGNLFLLSGTDPNEVYRWFMALYVDAYDWVMVPNVYGMSQFADGGLFATKPYIAGASYIKKMSDHAPGPWEDIVTGLYWRFIAKHRSLFAKNHRLAMMPKLLDRLPQGRRDHLLSLAEAFLAKTPEQTP
jgi:deoxyribodipyrimidine photolyase-related protein